MTEVWTNKNQTINWWQTHLPYVGSPEWSDEFEHIGVADCGFLCLERLMEGTFIS